MNGKEQDYFKKAKLFSGVVGYPPPPPVLQREGRITEREGR
jgi:hypothetical protein